MELKISYKKLANILLGLGCLLTICSIFCFFGAGFNEIVKIESEFLPLPTFTVVGPSMFSLMFGGVWVDAFETHFDAYAGLTALFVIAMIALAIALVIIIGIVSKKINQNAISLIAIIMCAVILVAVIMSFCTLKLLNNLDELEIEGGVIKLGSGAISYSVLGLIALLSSVGGVILSKKAA
ncbi:MAG: hypothetical protein MJ206_02860 [Bacilli bacterium]|nr:hypothetical protein [Bacilli bacterium]